jgi:lipopolysaccharide/colanic/teichoic acid biosynthesis glycosyltransferase
VSSILARAGKRLFDLGGASILTVLLAPLMLGVALAIRLDTPGPVLFRQQRLGRRGRPFTIFKFRTMLRGSESLGSGLETCRSDWRITGVGAVLRNHRLDELPQLFNVLAGDMSLVGPRPLLAAGLPHYSALARRRLEAVPGMTGWQQVHGAARNSWQDRVALDAWYVDHQGFLLDLWILVLTVRVVLRAEGAYAEDGSQRSGVPDPGPGEEDHDRH